MAAAPHSNLDMLSWFGEDERDACSACGQKTCVSVPDALASFCLSCGAVSVNGVRIDANRRVVPT